MQRMLPRYQIEDLTNNGDTLYLAHVPGIGMDWTLNADDAFKYEDAEEADDDAALHGGVVVELSTFTSPTITERMAFEAALEAAE